MRIPGITTLIVVMLSTAVAQAEDMPWLAESGWIDAKAAGATGDGRTDDTAALAALTTDKLSHGGATLYLRDGTYVVSGTWQLNSKRMVVQGQSRARTIIRLADNAPGFQDAKKPRPVVSWIGYTANGLPPNFPKNRGMGQAFCNGLYDVTVEVGAGNPGAIACYFINNNQGAMRNVTLRAAAGSGHIGLAMQYAWPGPGLITDLLVEGFDQGIRAGHNQYSMVFDRVTLRGQREAGIVNDGQLLRIARLDSDNRVPAVLNRSFTSSLVLVDSVLAGAGEAAIVNRPVGPNKYAPKPDAWLPAAFLRTVEVRGYKAAVRSSYQGGDETVPAGRIGEWSSHHGMAFDGSPARVVTLPLPLDDPVLPPFAPAAAWVSVAAHGAKPGEDATAAIQAALDSGASTVWFPRGQYQVSDTLRIRGAVTRIFGADASIRTKGLNDGRPLFVVEGTQPTVVVERLHDSYGDCRTWFEHTAATTLVLRHGLMSGYRNTVPGGRVFIEDVCGSNWDFRGQRVVARQFNVESKPPNWNVRIRGGSLAILGFKTEYGQTTIDADEGAQIEVLGGFHYHGSKETGYVLGDARLSLVGIVTHEGFAVLVRRTRGEVVEELIRKVWHPHTNKEPMVPGLVRVYGQHIPVFAAE